MPILYREPVSHLLKNLIKNNIIREAALDIARDQKMGFKNNNPLIIMKKGDSIKLVVDARDLNSITDLSEYSFPIEPIDMQILQLWATLFSVADLQFAYGHVPLDEETQNL